MSVYKPAKSPYYQYDFQFSNRRFYGSTGCKTKRDALRFEEKLRAKVARGDIERVAITLNDACGLYFDKTEGQPSADDSQRTMKALIAEFGAGRLLREIEQRNLVAFITKRRGTRKNSSVNREIRTIRAIWRLAEKSRFQIGEMPDWSALFLKENATTSRELSAVEEGNLFANIRPDLFDFCRFALMTGWRKSEVMSLLWDNVDLVAGEAITTIKGGDTILRPLTSEMVALIANQPRVAPYVFTYVAQHSRPRYVDSKGRQQPHRIKGERYPLTSMVIRLPWDRAKRLGEVSNFRFHDLRHTRATRMVRVTGNLATTRAALVS